MRRAALAAALAALVPCAGSAQRFHGVVLDEASQRAVPTAAVYLLDADDEPRASALTDAAGRYALEIPGDGSYRIVVERFGYFETRSPLLAVTTDRDYGVDLSVRPEPIRVGGLSVTVRNERVEDWLTAALGVSPYSVWGFRQIQGERLARAIEKSDDGIEMLRWLYLPVFNRTSGLCIGLYTGRGCADLYVDGQALLPELVETVDLDRVVTVLIVPPALHLLTREFDFAPFFAMPIPREDGEGLPKPGRRGPGRKRPGGPGSG